LCNKVTIPESDATLATDGKFTLNVTRLGSRIPGTDIGVEVMVLVEVEVLLEVKLLVLVVVVEEDVIVEVEVEVLLEVDVILDGVDVDEGAIIHDANTERKMVPSENTASREGRACVPLTPASVLTNARF
jgi:hypothetical protein